MILKADNILNVLLTPACQAVITKTTQEHIPSLQYHAVALKKGEHRHQLTHRPPIGTVAVLEKTESSNLRVNGHTIVLNITPNAILTPKDS